MGLRDNSPTVIGGLRWESCEKLSVGRIGFAFKTECRQSRVVSTLGLISIRTMVMVLREADFIGQGTGFRVSFSGFILMGLSGSFT